MGIDELGFVRRGKDEIAIKVELLGSKLCRLFIFDAAPVSDSSKIH